MFDTRFENAQTFIWNNARLLDRQVFACLFQGGSPAAVVTALKAYQNPDGGFGNALEPDKRTPHSQPVDVERALYILDRVGALGDDSARRELVQPVFAFLESITTPAGGLPFALPSVNPYPHAPWWEISANPPANLNPTAEIVGLLLKHHYRHPWLERAEAFCWAEIERLDTDQYHVLMPVITFLEHTSDRARAQGQLERVAELIRRPGIVEFDPQAGGYVKMPLDWAPLPDSFCRRLFDADTLDRHLQALAQKQQPDGGWPISWDPISPAVELEWRGWVTIEALSTLRAYAGQV